MVELQMSDVQVTVSAQLRCNAHFPQVYEAPGGLFPMRAKTFELSEYRMKAGWPVPIPGHDIFARTLVSGEGEKFSNRDNPATIRTKATTRWIAEGFNYDTLAWNPIQDETQGLQWYSSASYAPVLLTDYAYRLGGEVFIHSALNFDSDNQNHLWTDLSATYGGASGYTVLMVMSPNSTYGNDPTVPYNGLWCPGHPSPGTETFTEPAPTYFSAVTMQGYYLYYEDELKERTRTVSIANGLGANAPVYIALVMGRPDIAFYCGNGPSSITVKHIPAGGTTPVPLDGHITLGRTPGDVLHTADMALFDLGLYGRPLSATEIQTEFALLSQCYGGVAR